MWKTETCIIVAFFFVVCVCVGGLKYVLSILVSPRRMSYCSCNKALGVGGEQLDQVLYYYHTVNTIGNVNRDQYTMSSTFNIHRAKITFFFLVYA